MNDYIINIDNLFNVNNINSSYADSICDFSLSNYVLPFFQIYIWSINNHFNELAMLLGSKKKII